MVHSHQIADQRSGPCPNYVIPPAGETGSEGELVNLLELVKIFQVTILVLITNTLELNI
jgi:hypothetical protein